jgi:hypothetical protein
MATHKPRLERRRENIGTQRLRPSTFVIASFLIKLAKHMALIACLMIAGSATGRATISQLAIFLLTVAAAGLYSIGHSLRRRLPALGRLSIDGP